jgi:zinc transport system permease protein
MHDSWLDRLNDQLTEVVNAAAQLFPAGTYLSYSWTIHSLLAVVLVSLVCGAVGSLVVGNRMAFYSDALAHCAIAGVALGILLALFAGVPQTGISRWIMPTMLVFGVAIGLAIAFVRETTSLASDTVIGVFFAGAMGFGAMLLKAQAGNTRVFASPESLLFGELLAVGALDLLYLLALALLTAGVLAVMYNQLVFASFSPSLARSRRVRVRLCNYVFIVLLALIVNLCVKVVGVLLINALLIVPAATAANVCRNMRQLFWLTIILCLLSGCLGHYLSHFEYSLPNGRDLQFGPAGTIVTVSVLLFFASMVAAPWLGLRRQTVVSG